MKLTDIPFILTIMEQEALKCNAPVFKVEKAKRTSFELLVFVLLSARTRDETTLKAVERLFRIAHTPQKIAELQVSKLETILYGVGFYRTKARNLIKMSRMIDGQFKGVVPQTIEELLTLPGIGRKSANIVLASHFGKEVIGVDTHVHRISNRLAWVKTKKPLETENELMKVIPKQYLRTMNKLFVAYGQTICQPISPLCSICKLKETYCPQVGVKKSR